MDQTDFRRQLSHLGPEALQARKTPFTLEEARAYCRDLTRSHYENFTVAGFLLPKHLREPFYAIYAYCRWADDLGDEVGDRSRSLELLDWWEDELNACFHRRARHPVFIALAEVVRRHALPREPLADLLVAFRRDQSPRRFADLADLDDYCRYSANPVGRLILHLDGEPTPEDLTLSDAICSGLQWTNFWQDVARDWRIGRCYLPESLCRQYDYDLQRVAMLPEKNRGDDRFRALMRHLVDLTEMRFRQGEPLVDRVSSSLRRQVMLFLGGGRAVLQAIRRIDYDTWAVRPTVSRGKKVSVFLHSFWKMPFA
jgi:squalene synthase HpnC